MPENIRLTGMDKLGISRDTPSIILPHSQLSDSLNVRFRNNSINKMRGETDVLGGAFQVPTIVNGQETSNLENISLSNLHYWPNPRLVGQRSGFYITGTPGRQYLIRPEINRNANAIAPRLVNQLDADGDIVLYDADGRWDTDTFTGGFALIHNNGIQAPQFMLDTGNDNTLMLQDLPGWNYTGGRLVSAGIVRSFGNVLIAGNLRRAIAAWELDPPFVYRLTEFGESPNDFPEGYAFGTDGVVYRRIQTTSINPNADPTTPGVSAPVELERLPDGDILADPRVNPITVQWVATSLDRFTNLTGTIRVSNAAAPGTVPQSWDPFLATSDFAEERELTDTSEVRNMVPLQGQMIIYTSDSIHSLSLGVGGNVVTSQVAQGWGTLNNNSVVEFDGKHFVVDVDDIYLFTGHPGNIQSVADGRIRDYLYSNLHPVAIDNVHAVLNKSQDEIWINFPNRQSINEFCNEALIWNYRTNTWTRRDLNGVVASVDGPVTGGGLPQQQFIFGGFTGEERNFTGNPEVQTITVNNNTFVTPGDEAIGFDLAFAGETGAVSYTPPAIGSQADEFTRTAESSRRVIEESATPEAFDATQTLFTDPEGNTVDATLQAQRTIETFSEEVDNDPNPNQISTSNLTVTPVQTENTATDFLVQDRESKTITSEFSGSGTSYSPTDLNSGITPAPSSGITVANSSHEVRPIVSYSAVNSGTVTEVTHTNGASRSITYTETVTTGGPAGGSVTVLGNGGAVRGSGAQSVPRTVALPTTSASGDTITTTAFTASGSFPHASFGSWGFTMFLSNSAGAQVGPVLFNSGFIAGGPGTTGVGRIRTVTIPAQTFNITTAGATHFTILGTVAAQFNTQGMDDDPAVASGSFNTFTITTNQNRQSTQTFTNTLTAAGGIAQDGDTSANAGQTVSRPNPGPRGGSTSGPSSVTGQSSQVSTRTVTVPGIPVLNDQDPTTILGTRSGNAISTSNPSNGFRFYNSPSSGVVLSNSNRTAQVQASGSGTRNAASNTVRRTAYTITNSSDGETDFMFTPGTLIRTGTTSVTNDVFNYTINPSGVSGTIPLTGGAINDVPAGGTVDISAEFSVTPSNALDTTTVISANANSTISGTRELPGFTHTVMNPSGVPTTVTLTTDDGTETQTIQPGDTARFFDTGMRSRDSNVNTITSSRMLYDYDVTASGGVPLIATIRAVPSGSVLLTTDTRTTGFITDTTERLVVGSEVPTYTAFSREGEDFEDHHILSITNNGNQDFDLTMITHGMTNSFTSGTVTFNPPTMANLIVPPGATRQLFATASVTDNVEVGRLEVGAGNDHMITGIGRYTGDPTTLSVEFNANVDVFDVPAISHTFTGQQTGSEAAAEFLAILLDDDEFNNAFTASIDEDTPEVINILVQEDNRADYTASEVESAGTTARGSTAFDAMFTEVQAPSATPGRSSAITISVSGTSISSVNTNNARVSIRPDGFEMPQRDLDAFTASETIIFGEALANGGEIASAIADEITRNIAFPFNATANNNVITLTSRDTVVDGVVQPANRPYDQVTIAIAEAGIVDLQESDFTENTITDGLTDNTHGRNTQIEVNLLTLDPDNPNAEPIRERIGDVITLEASDTPQSIANMVTNRFNERSIAGFVIEYDGDRTIDLRLADLSVSDSQAFEVRTFDINSEMFTSENISSANPPIITGSVSDTSRTGSPISTDNSLIVDSSGNAEIFNNERPWPTDEFNDARTFVVMARPTANTLTAADIGFTFVNDDFDPMDPESLPVRPYASYFERTQIDMAQAIDSMDTKHLKSVYIQSQAVAGGNDADFDVKVRATNTPADIPDLTISRDDMNNIDPSNNNQVAQAVDFNTEDDYKSDVRITGRYLSYRVEENGSDGWSIPTIELEIDTAGRR